MLNSSPAESIFSPCVDAACNNRATVTLLCHLIARAEEGDHREHLVDALYGFRRVIWHPIRWNAA